MHGRPPSSRSASTRAGAILDEARATLRGIAERPPLGIDRPAASAVAARAMERLAWAGSWLDEPYRAGAPARRDGGIARLRELADACEELVESFEDEDPVANANGVQTGSLAFAIVSHVASYLARLGARS